MYKTILVPLDGSERAEGILAHVTELAKCTGASLVLLRIVEPIPAAVASYEAWPTVYLEQIQSMMKDAETYLDARASELRQNGLTVETEVVHGPVVGSIIEAAEKVDASLIAMASHGRSGLGHVFYGSVASGVLNRIDRPLLLIRSR